MGDQFKRAQVVMLPTMDKSRLHNTFGVLRQERGNDLSPCNQHLYITSDDEIKEGDWCYFKGTKEVIKYPNGGFPNGFSKKVIATTYSSLMTLGKFNTGPGQVGYPKYYIPQPSQQFIEKYIEAYNKGEIITDVLVEHSPRYINKGGVETIDCTNSMPHHFWGEAKDYILKVNPKDNTITIKKLKDSWNKEEMLSNMLQAWIRASSLQKTNGFSNYSDEEIEDEFETWSNNNPW
jgi:hypothetical protein